MTVARVSGHGGQWLTALLAGLRAVPPSAFQSRAVWPWEAVASQVPSGKMATANTHALRALYPGAGVLKEIALPVAMPVLIHAMRD